MNYLGTFAKNQMPTNTRASVLSFLLQLLIWLSLYYCWASLVAQTVKNPLQCRRPGFNPWVGEIPWRKAWQHTPVFLPGEFHGQRKFFLYWFFVFLNSTMFGEYWSSVLGLILFFFIDIYTLFSVSVDDLSQYFNCHLSAVDSNFHLQPIPISSTSASHFQLVIWYPL